MSVYTSEPVDEDGNLSFGMGEGLNVPISEIAEDGTSVNISTQLRYFNAWSGNALIIRKLLAADPNNATGRLLLLSVAELQPAIVQLCTFNLTDEDGAVPIALWEGTLSMRNPANA